MIAWKMSFLMRKHGITSKKLAETMDWPEGTIKNLRQLKSLPAIKGERLEQLITGLETSAKAEIKLSDLIERTKE